MREKIFNIIRKLGGARVLRLLNGERITVLCLHRITEDFDYFFNPINPHEFEQLVNYCRKYYSITTFSSINEKKDKPKLIFSFDDGYYDFVENAIPILSKYNLPSNHNFVNECLNSNAIIWTQKVNDIFNHLKNNSIFDEELIVELGGKFTGNWWNQYIPFLNKMFTYDEQKRDDIIELLTKKYNIRNEYRMMDWNDLKLCRDKYKVEIGSHTYHHYAFNDDSRREIFDREIAESISEFENFLQEKVNVLSLPNGLFNEKVLNYIDDIGVEFVLLINNKFNRPADMQEKFKRVNRIYLMQESIEEMVLRTEGFHMRFGSK